MKKTLVGVLGVLLLASVVVCAAIIEVPEAIGRNISVIVGGSPPSEGCTEPAAGTTLGGNSLYNDAWTGQDSVSAYWDNTGKTITWSETCTTTTASKMQIYAEAWDGGNVKGLIYKDGNLVTNGATNSTSVTGWSAGWHDLTFATPPTLTKGSTYKLAILLDNNYAISFSLQNNAGTIYYQNMTYSSPSATITGSEVATGDIAIRVVK